MLSFVTKMLFAGIVCWVTCRVSSIDIMPKVLNFSIKIDFLIGRVYV